VAEQNQFGQKPATTPRGGQPTLRCEDWEGMLADALDQALSARDQAAFDAHAAGCTGCSDLLAHARQGQEWLGFLHAEPEVPAGLVSKILDKTTGAGAIPIPVIAGAEQGAGAAATAIPWRRSFQETRLLMTVAMAFFSIALTLNMAGVKLTSLRLADLRPSTIGNTLSRQFYSTWGQISKFYNNARFVYELESKVRELRRDSETPQPAPQKKVGPSSRNEEEPGSGLRAQNGVRRSALGVQDGASGVPRTAFGVQSSIPRTAFGVPPTEREIQGTEVEDLNFAGNEEAGPRRMAGIAGNDGRSLA
jgi:hypothetical protein